MNFQDRFPSICPIKTDEEIATKWIHINWVDKFLLDKQRVKEAIELEYRRNGDGFGNGYG